MKLGKMGLWAMVACVGIGVSACSAKDDLAPSKAEAPQRALFQAADSAAINFYCGCDQAFADQVVEQTKQKYPNISMNVYVQKKSTDLQDTIASGVSLDLIYNSLGQIFRVQDLKLATDLLPLTQAYQYDLNRFIPGAIETMKSYSGEGKLEFMPFEQKSIVLMYNKSLFDKFGVGYPKDGMTWSQVQDVVARMTRTDAGIKYYGIGFWPQQLLYKNQLALPFVNKTSSTAAVDTDEWKNWMNVMTGFYKVPGHLTSLNLNPVNLFLRNGTLSMLITSNLLGTTDMDNAAKTGLDWDMASSPNFPGVQGGQLNTSFFSIPESSKNQDAAFRVIETMLSDEVQAARAKRGSVPIVKSEQAKATFASELPYAKGRNLEALFKDPIAEPIVSTRYDGGAKDKILIKTYNDIASGAKDSVTALREAQEALNKYITENK